MVFFDLSIPYNDTNSKSTAAAADDKKVQRLKTVVKLMELGYTGVAYDSQIKGVMSDKDRCTIAPFPLSSLLKAAPSLADSVKFHREILGVPTSTPFRQYRRLTVVVDSVLQCAALNTGNPVLKTYDLVAVMPVNQVSFDQACKVAEVDLIAIDFSRDLPFRLKLPMIKAAIERGVYFEISYSHLISKTKPKRESMPNAKMLVNWTRGKNLIISSAASTANEVRGPYDVANLSSLLGLSNEYAKAAVSRNCRMLLASALRKKQCYKEVIRVERISPDKLNSNLDLHRDWRSWDPISSGDGDLPSLDEFSKFFSESMDTHKLQRSCFSTRSVVIPKSGANENQTCNATNDSSKDFRFSFVDTEDQSPHLARLESPRFERHDNNISAATVPLTPSPSMPSECDFLPLTGLKGCSSMKSGHVVTIQDQVTVSKMDDFMTGKQPSYDASLQDNIAKNLLGSGLPNKSDSTISHLKRHKSSNVDLIVPDAVETRSNGSFGVMPTFHDKIYLMPCSGLDISMSSSATERSHLNSMENDSPNIRDGGICIPSDIGDDTKLNDTPVEKALAVPVNLVSDDFVLYSPEGSFPEVGQSMQRDEAIPSDDVMTIEETFDKFGVPEQCDLVSVKPNILSKDSRTTEGQFQEYSSSASPAAEKRKLGKIRFIRDLRRQSSKVPSKGLLKPLLFKRKVQQPKRYNKRCQ